MKMATVSFGRIEAGSIIVRRTIEIMARTGTSGTWECTRDRSKRRERRLSYRASGRILNTSEIRLGWQLS